MLILPSVGIRTAVSQESEEERKEEIKRELENLKSIILGLDRDFFNNSRSAEGNRRALINKIDAVISQVEHEAYKGALGKLENDLKSVVELWIKKDKAFELILIIEGIIELILKITLPPAPPPFVDITPPNITSVVQVPETPSYDENVTVIAEVEDEESGVEQVILNYSINEKDWTNINMSRLGGDLYEGEISAHPFNTTVYYKVHAYDEAGNLAVSDIYNYTVIDPYEPEIAWVERSPLSPNYNDTVSITASVSEPKEASGVQLVILSYFDGSIWTNVTMRREDEDIYKETIPALPYNTTVEYIVYASDKAENWASRNFSYTVGDEYPPTVRIDKPTQGSYVKGKVDIAVHFFDDNLKRADLIINQTVIATWQSSGSDEIEWDTADYEDGKYIIKLIAFDKAGNTAEESVTVTLDKTAPSATIDEPFEESFLKGLVDIIFTGDDNNFKEMQLYINSTLVWTEYKNGTYTYPWNTFDYTDGKFIITLKVYDLAENVVIVHRKVIVDNTPPEAEIRKPQKDAYIKGVYDIVIYGNDTNFAQMKLYVPNNIIEFAKGEQTYPWDTSEVNDGNYTLKLIVSDLAGNIIERKVSVTIDNTPPTGKFNLPTEGAFLKGSVIISITGEDANLEKMQLYIGVNLALTVTANGTYPYEWNTLVYNDGDYILKLEVTDKARNTFATEIQVTVDNTPPEAEIMRPLSEEYISGSIVFKIYGADANFDKMLFYIGDEVFSEVYESGEYSNVWNTEEYVDGVYQIKLVVSDKAGNLAEEVILVTVDNKLPVAAIHTPAEKAILKGTVLINVTGNDENFKEMELKIDDVRIKNWTQAGTLVYLWNTAAYLDGNHTITLIVYDKANNTEKAAVMVTVDNTSPVIMAPTWSPKEPSINELVIVTAKVTDPYPGSGIKTVILWFRNTTMKDWHALLMSLDVESGNWTTTIPAQSMETTVRFYIEAFDKADNKAVREEIDEYKVTLPPAGFPLAWIAALILIILTATIAAVYFWRKRRRKRQGLSSRLKNYKLTILLCF
jgi:hypothetical protein